MPSFVTSNFDLLDKFSVLLPISWSFFFFEILVVDDEIDGDVGRDDLTEDDKFDCLVPVFSDFVLAFF